MRIHLPLTIVLVLAASTSAQFDFNLDDIKTTFKEDVGGFFSNAGDDIKGFFGSVGEKGKKFKEQLLQKVKDGLPERVKKMLGNGNFSQADVQEMLDGTTPEAWNAFKLEQLTTLGKDKMADLVTRGKGKIPERVRQQLATLQTMAFTSPEDAVRTLKDNMQECRGMLADLNGGVPSEVTRTTPACGLKPGQVKILQGILGEPKDWNKDNVTTLDKLVLLYPPKALSMVKNATVRDEIIKVVDACKVTNPPADCPPAQLVARAGKALEKAKYGPPKDWTAQAVTAMGGVNRVPIRALMATSDKTITDLKSDLVAMSVSGRDAVGVVRRLAKAENVMSMDKTKTTQWITSLGALSGYVTPAMLSDAAMMDQDVMNTVQNNLKNNAANLPPAMAKGAVTSAIKGKSLANLTETEINNIGGELMVQAPPGLVSRLAKRGLLKGEALTQAAENLAKAPGPGFSVKVSSVIDALLKERPQISNLPRSVLPLVDPELLQGESQAVLDTLVSEARSSGVQFDDRMTAFLASKYSPSEMVNMPVSVKSEVSKAALDGLDAATLTTFAQTMPPTSSASLMLAKRVWTTPLTATAVSANLALLPLLQPSVANTTTQADLTEILALMAGAPQQPSMAVCRVMKNKLMMMMMNTSGLEDPDEIAEALTTSELQEMPPCVVAALGGEAVDALTEGQAATVAQRLTTRDNTRSTSPKARRRLLQKALKAMGLEGSLGADDLELLGASVLDLSPEVMRGVTPDGAAVIVKEAEAAYRSTNPPCLTSTEMSALASTLEKAKGRFEEWDTAEDACCLLALLPSASLNRVPSEVTASCTCPDPPPGSKDEMDAAKASCRAALGERAAEAWMKAKDALMDRQVDAGLMALGDFNAAAGTANRRRRQASSTTACDRAAVGGADVLTTTELRNMAADDVAACLAELTQTEMSAEKGKIIIDMMKMARGNLSMLTSDDMLNLKWAWSGLSKTQAEELPALSDVALVEALGMDWDIDMEAVKVVAQKVLTEFKAAGELSGQELVKVNNLVCGFTPTQVNAITTSAFSSAVVRLRDLEDCMQEVVEALASKAEATYGNVANWDAAILNEMGLLVTGMSPEQLRKVPANAFVGLTPSAMEEMDPNLAKSLLVSQLESLSTETALAITDEQKSEFNEDMKKALENVLEATYDNAAAGVVATLSLLIPAAVLLMA